MFPSVPGNLRAPAENGEERKEKEREREKERKRKRGNQRRDHAVRRNSSGKKIKQLEDCFGFFVLV